MKTFTDLDNYREAIHAIYNGYAFRCSYREPAFIWSVHDAVVANNTHQLGWDNSEDISHGMMQHFGCLDASLD